MSVSVLCTFYNIKNYLYLPVIIVAVVMFESIAPKAKVFEWKMSEKKKKQIIERTKASETTKTMTTTGEEKTEKKKKTRDTRRYSV